jgi:hypothetical protein
MKRIFFFLTLCLIAICILSCDDCERVDCFDTSENFVFVRYYQEEGWTDDLNDGRDFFIDRAGLLENIIIESLTEVGMTETGRVVFKTHENHPEISDYLIALEIKAGIAGYIIKVAQLPADTLRFQLYDAVTKCCGSVTTLQNLEYSGDGSAGFTASSIWIVK